MGSSDPLYARTHSALRELGVTEQSRLLIGISGGIDSVTLAYVLHRLYRDHVFAHLSLVHINHQLRGDESEDDERFARTFAATLNIPLHVEHAPTLLRHELTRESIELAARNERYDIFKSLAATERISHVLTAHHADDQVETVLMNLLRGAGLRGLGGIPPTCMLMNEIALIRPWLDVWREEIVQFAQSQKVSFRTDSSNASLDFTRNKIRHGLLPYLAEQFPERNIRTSIHQMSGILRSEAQTLQELAEYHFDRIERPLAESLLPRKAIALDLFALLQIETGLWHDIMGSALQKLCGERRSINATAAMHIAQLLRSEQTKLELGQQIVIQKEGDLLVIFEQEPSISIVEQNIELIEGYEAQTAIGTIRVEVLQKCEIVRDKHYAYFDFTEVRKQGLVIREWKAGDKMQPFGMRGSKLISDLLNEAGVRTLREKQRVPVIAAAKTGEIVWVPGVRASESFKVTEATIDMLRLHLVVQLGLATIALF